MRFETFKEVAQFRINENEDNYWIEDYWKAAIEFYTANISDTIEFFRSECNDEEFYWLSEIFEEIAEKSQSKELIQVLKNRLATVLPENYHQQDFKSEHMRNGLIIPSM